MALYCNSRNGNIKDDCAIGFWTHADPIYLHRQRNEDGLPLDMMDEGFTKDSKKNYSNTDLLTTHAVSEKVSGGGTKKII